MDKENLNGQMAENIKVNGKMVNSTDKVYILMHKVKRKKENGLMERELDGLMMTKRMIEINID